MSYYPSEEYYYYGNEGTEAPEEDGYTCALCHSTYEKDLQLAAELGKTLLERNKELENSLRQHQCLIEDRTQEIEYLTKQTAALREVNESRLRIYEQLEISIQDLERTNHRLSIDSSADKKQIKSLLANIEALELRCEELQRALDEITVEVERERMKSRRLSACSPMETELPPLDATGEELNKLLKDNQMLKTKTAKCERKIIELEQQISSLLEENELLNEDSNKLLQKEEYIRCLQEEVSTLEQIRQGKLCQICLQNTDNKFRLTAEDDDESIADSLLLDEKQDAFLKIQERRPNLVHMLWELSTTPEAYYMLLSELRIAVRRRLVPPSIIPYCLRAHLRSGIGLNYVKSDLQEALKRCLPVPPSLTLPLPSLTLPAPSITLPVPSLTLPLPSITLPVPSLALSLPSITLPVPSVSLPSITLPVPSVSLPLPSLSLPYSLSSSLLKRLGLTK